MSKQLIHSFKSHVIVAALSDRAFAAVANEKSTNANARVMELLPPHTTEKKSKSNGKDGNEKAKSIIENLGGSASACPKWNDSN